MALTGKFIILKSSKKSYNVVFDRYAESFEENMSVVVWVGRLEKYKCTQLFGYAMYQKKFSSQSSAKR
jgi:hypothetical protein